MAVMPISFGALSAWQHHSTVRRKYSSARHSCCFRGLGSSNGFRFSSQTIKFARTTSAVLASTTEDGISGVDEPLPERSGQGDEENEAVSSSEAEPVKAVGSTSGGTCTSSALHKQVYTAPFIAAPIHCGSGMQGII